MGYLNWLHLKWPAGKVEKLPEVNGDGTTNVPGVFIVGDLTGIPLLKFALKTGAEVARKCFAELGDPAARKTAGDDDIPDLVVIGAGVAGVSCAIQAKKLGLRVQVLESSSPFSTIVNFPKRKPIFVYPNDLDPESELEVTADVKEALLDELQEQLEAADLDIKHEVYATKISKDKNGLSVEVKDGEPIRALRVVVAIGRSGNYRRLNVPGEDLDKVANRLFDANDHKGNDVLVVGGGDSAAEAAIALSEAGARVALSYRGKELSRPKPENVRSVQNLADTGKLNLQLGSTVKEITKDQVSLNTKDGEQTLKNDAVLALIGREPPLDFFRRSGLRVKRDWDWRRVAAFAAFLLFCLWMYTTKTEKIAAPAEEGTLEASVRKIVQNPFKDLSPNQYTDASTERPANHRVAIWGQEGPELLPKDTEVNSGSVFVIDSSFGGVVKESTAHLGFWYSLLYCIIICWFGYRRVQRRKTPYVKKQTITLALFQVIPLFLLPYIVFPWLGLNGFLPEGFLDAFFPEAYYGHGREYWRAFGFVLAWPLFFFNFHTAEPMMWWLLVGGIQTFVIIPLIIRKWGKGAYCGWICSCGALAETLGDTHREKMPHGPIWNRLNIAGQVILAVIMVSFLLRIGMWVYGTESWFGQALAVSQIDPAYYWIVDVGLAGIVGVGFYFWFSGRVWCRFFCPLAALMHIFSRFSRFRIIPEKKKCISCNVCTSVCHQGIDVMSFAQTGRNMEDPECVRCSACVQMCPTGVLQFGEVDSDGNAIRYDSLAASPVLMREGQEQL